MRKARTLLWGLVLFSLGCSSGNAAEILDAAVADQTPATSPDAGGSEAGPGADAAPADAARSDACASFCQPCPGGPVYCAPNCPTYGCPAPLDASADAGYGACFGGDGGVAAPLKACQSDLECSFAYHQTNCCGTREWVGIATAHAEFPACERAWDSHFPACGCATGPTTAEDGKTSDGGAPQVHCVLTSGASGLCETWLP